MTPPADLLGSCLLGLQCSAAADSNHIGVVQLEDAAGVV